MPWLLTEPSSNLCQRNKTKHDKQDIVGLLDCMHAMGTGIPTHTKHMHPEPKKISYNCAKTTKITIRIQCWFIKCLLNSSGTKLSSLEGCTSTHSEDEDSGGEGG